MGAAGAGLSLSFLFLAQAAWGLAPLPAISFAGATGLLVILGASRLRAPAEPMPGDDDPALETRPAFLDPRVNLPSDWRERLERARRSQSKLPDAVKGRIAGLARWERLVLALSTVPDHEPTAYERTTPGLHFWTHCPYPQVGAELRDVNARAPDICGAHRVPCPPGRSPLVEHRTGYATGLKSGRAGIYRLTPAGKLVAAKIRDRIGAQDIPNSALREALGECFGPSKPAQR